MSTPHPEGLAMKTPRHKTEAWRLRMEAFKAEVARAEAKGLQILPSVRGPYAHDPVRGQVLGAQGSPEYAAAVA